MKSNTESPLIADDLRRQVAQDEHAQDNGTLAHILSEIAELIELEGGSAVYRARAYRKAAETLGTLNVGVAGIYRERGSAGLQQIPNIGKSIAERLVELLTTGRSTLHDELTAKYPPGMVELMSAPGVGPKTAYKLSAEYGISSLPQLEEAARAGRLQQLFRWQGARLEEGILSWVSRSRLHERRVPRYLTEPLAEALAEGAQNCPGVVEAEIVGSYRRLEETVGNLDFVVASTDLPATQEAFSRLPQIRSILSRTPGHLTIVSHTGTQVDVHFVAPDLYDAALFYYTGSAGHLELVRARAAQRGTPMPQLGTPDMPPQVSGLAEPDIYAALDLPYIPPELRQGSDELSLAVTRDPATLLNLSHIQGDIHTHTDWSDGANTLDEMVQAAIERGYRYYAICDHSGGLGVAGGLSTERRAAQIAEIRALRDRLPAGFTLLAGIEVDILADGTLDCPDELLAQLDWVVASIHSFMRQDSDTITRRILSAIEHPLVNAIGHPTTRLLSGRPPADLDMEAIYAAALRTGTALEVNGGPERLDLNDQQARRARELGVKLIVSSDAHRLEHLDSFMQYAIGVARRAWCQPGDILNAGPLDEIYRFVAAKRR